MELVIAFLVGVVVTGFAFVVWGVNNQKKITAARAQILEVTTKVEGSVKQALDEVLSKLPGNK